MPDPTPVRRPGGTLPSLVATNGVAFCPDGPLTISRNADGSIAYQEITDPTTSKVYRRTHTYTNGLLTSATGWVEQ